MLFGVLLDSGVPTEDMSLDISEGVRSSCKFWRRFGFEAVLTLNRAPSKDARGLRT